MCAAVGGLDISIYSHGILCGDLLSRLEWAVDYTHKRIGFRRAAQREQGEQRGQGQGGVASLLGAGAGAVTEGAASVAAAAAEAAAAAASEFGRP